MDGGAHDTLWGMLQAAAAAAITGIAGVVAWLWKKVNSVDDLGKRVDVLAAAVDDVIDRQEKDAAEMRKSELILARVEETLVWLKTAISEINRKLDK